jgi:putative glycosyltransferase (TIGR04372 family)
MPLGYLINNNENDLIITKHHKHKKNKKELTLSEIFSSNVAICLKTEKYELNNVELEENSPEEIKDLVIEMDERLNGRWKDTKEDLLLQKRFWSIFEDRVKRLNLEKPLHGKTNARFGAKFLRENQNWIR